jgi:lysophospholipase L1-like esterase
MFTRYVAIGDSSTEGLDDPDGRGGYRGWANRLAERLAAAQGSVQYANLGIRGRRTRQILDDQLGPALAMKPDLVTVFSGTNDVVARRFDADQVAQDMERMQRRLNAAGATVVTFTLPDLTPVMPLARFIRGRVHRLNEALRHAASQSGAILVDVARHPVASDPRLWSSDRLHANALGHFRIAAALAHAIGLADTSDDWWQPLTEPLRRGLLERVRDEVRWGRDYLLPWVGRHLAGRSSGDGRVPKRPQLLPMDSSLRETG